MLHHRDPVRSALVEARPSRSGVSGEMDRALDLVVATAALILTSPLLALAALLVFMGRNGPVLFAHERVGCAGKTFPVLKFRTMCVDADRVLREHLLANPEAMEEWSADHKLRRDPRVSAFGNFLRKTSIDELPQLFNVLRGEMSIVGPRPITPAEIEKYGSLYPAYCSVRPGITGVWQVSGRNDVSYQRRVEMDALYARKKSVLLDLRLMFETIPALLTRRGSY